MVNQHHRFSRFAFTMIELIFAIVIIAISVISLPMMTQATSKGIDSSLVQEAIFAASAELMGASAGYWDANSTLDAGMTSMSKVINIGNPQCENNASSNRFRLRPGHIPQPKHRRCLDNLAAPAANTPNVALPNLDNAVKNNVLTFTNTATNAAGYKRAYTTTVGVANTGNVKIVTATIRDGVSSKTLVVLQMQSANIGEVEYHHRNF